jgi:hypothetical protein
MNVLLCVEIINKLKEDMCHQTPSRVFFSNHGKTPKKESWVKLKIAQKRAA